MDWEAIKLIGIAVSLVSSALTVGEKLCKWGKSAYQYIKKSKKLVAIREGSAVVPSLTIIGDTAQALYRFRGACPRQTYYRFYM
jgi:hypothetical protein